MKAFHLFTILVVLALLAVLALTIRAALATQTIVASQGALQAQEGTRPGPQNPTAATVLPPSTGAGLASSIKGGYPAILLLAGTYTNANQTVEMEISADGVMTLSSRIDPVGVRYTFTLAEDNLSITQPYCAVVSNDPEALTAAYEWTLDSDTLTLSAVGDPCALRSHDLAPGPWTRKHVCLV